MSPFLPLHGLLLAFVGLLGFMISEYILRTKTRKQPLICPIHHDCDVVVKSKYSALFGIPNEVMGMLYYGIVIIYGLLTTSGITTAWGIPLFFIFAAAAFAAFLTSVVLVFIQAIIIRHYCIWCLATALINLLLAGAAAQALFF